MRPERLPQPPPEEFERFASSLSCDERDAVQNWLGLLYLWMRSPQTTGPPPPGMTEEKLRMHVEAFDRALSKAVPCEGLVFRGLSAREGTDKAGDLLRLISGSDPVIDPFHSSASLCESIGISYCNIAPNDEPRSISVLLRVHARTARYLRPFRHAAKDEAEVVLLKGTSYRRLAVTEQDKPRPTQSYYWLELIEE